MALRRSVDCTKLLKPKVFGRGDRIRTCDFPRPRHRNTQGINRLNLHILKVLSRCHLRSGLATVVDIVAVEFLRIQHDSRPLMEQAERHSGPRVSQTRTGQSRSASGTAFDTTGTNTPQVTCGTSCLCHISFGIWPSQFMASSIACSTTLCITGCVRRLRPWTLMRGLSHATGDSISEA